MPPCLSPDSIGGFQSNRKAACEFEYGSKWKALECLQEALRRCTPSATPMPLAFINQSTPEIKRKLQRQKRLREKSSRDLVMVAKKVYTGRGRSEEKEVKKE